MPHSYFLPCNLCIPLPVSRPPQARPGLAARQQARSAAPCRPEVATRVLRIDRAAHMELAWQRRQAREAELQSIEGANLTGMRSKYP